MDSYPSRAYGIPQCVRRHRQQCFAVRLRVLRRQDQHLVGPLRLKRQQVRGIDGTPELNERIKGRLNHRKLRRIAAQNAAGQFTQRRELRNEAGGLVLKMVFSGQVCAPGLLAVSRRLQQLRGFGGSLALSRGERLELLREGCRHRQGHQNQAGHLPDIIIAQARFARGSGSWRTRADLEVCPTLVRVFPVPPLQQFGVMLHLRSEVHGTPEYVKNAAVHMVARLRGCATDWLLGGSYGELVSTRIGEMEAPPAGKRKDLLDDCAIRRAHLRFHAGEIGRIDYNQWPSGRSRALPPEPAREPAVFKAGIVRAVVGEFPAEDTGIESLRFGDIGGRELDVVYPAFV